MMNLNAEDNSVALEDETPHWTKEYLGNQRRWDELLKVQFPAARLIKWGINNRVYILDGRIIKVSFVGSKGDGVERHNLRTEFEMNEEIFELTVGLGGTLSGEHGIGLVQKRYMPIAFNDVQLNLMKSIKAVFDPKGIMNPGKIFE